MDWSKLTSRKLWMAIAGFVSMLAVSFGVDASEAEQIAALIMAGAMVLAYIVGEGLVDKASAGAPTTIVSGPTE
jgi:lipopolysaccharide export LptBFGC system permease protein LptF